MSNFTAEARRDGGDRFIASSDHRAIWKTVMYALRVVLDALREVFDESAYERFLTRTQSARSRASYREFLQERELAAARKHRCC
jgi:hypothetical protein